MRRWRVGGDLTNCRAAQVALTSGARAMVVEFDARTRREHRGTVRRGTRSDPPTSGPAENTEAKFRASRTATREPQVEFSYIMM